MPATTTKKKSYRLFKVASELNLGRETIVEFLNGKGIEVPNKATTKLTPEAYDLIMAKFEREHRQIEKQRRKVDAYHERRTRTRQEEEAEEEEEAAEEEKAVQAISRNLETLNQVKYLCISWKKRSTSYWPDGTPFR